MPSPTIQAPPQLPDFQADFSGGSNEVCHPLLLAPNEVQLLQNGFAKIGGGIEGRGGFKLYPKVETDQGTSIFEMEQSTGTILTFVAAGSNFYDETMWPRYRLFVQTPGTGDMVYLGAREPFNSLVLFAILGLSPPGAGNTFVWEIFKGGDYTVLANWQDITAQVVENVANSKQMRGVSGEWIFSWPNQALWAAGQVETRGYQYWLRIRCTLGGTNMGTDIVQGQRRVRGDWVGRRHLMTADTGHLTEWPGLTVTPRVIETWPTGQRIPRVNARVINDHLYYASDGQRPLMRSNGSRGVTRAGGTNVPAPAGLVVPNAAPVLTQPTANPNAYPVAFVIRYRLAFEHGPEGILGESRPSASAELTLAGVASNVRVGFAAAVTQAATIPVNAILVYATYNLVNKIGSQRDYLGAYLPVKRVARDDADWNAGFWEDTFVERLQRGPIAYDNSPPFYPKYVETGAERLWIANENTVAASDVGRGDSWDPTLQFFFPGGIRGILYRGDRLLVFHGRDISYIFGINEGLPERNYFKRGVSLAQPDTLCVWNDQVHFVSTMGPARIIGNDVEFTAKGRVWEGPTFWSSSAAQRRLASAAAHEGKIWFGIDSSGAGPGLINKSATLDLNVNQRGAWSYQYHKNGGFRWGTFGVVHAPLDHPLARKRILCAFPDGSLSASYYKLAVLEYGTTDDWSSAETDGTKIISQFYGRGISMKAADRWKKFKFAHIRHRLMVTNSPIGAANCSLVSNNGRVESKSLSRDGLASQIDDDWLFEPTENAGGGPYRETSPSIFYQASHDTGWTFAMWLVKAEIEPEKIL